MMLINTGNTVSMSIFNDDQELSNNSLTVQYNVNICFLFFFSPRLQAYKYLREEVKIFQGKPIMVNNLTEHTQQCLKLLLLIIN